LQNYYPGANEFAMKIAEWTINNNMIDKDGYFYYRKYKLYTNKISYMRWSNAWMFLAFTEYILMNKKTIRND